MEENKNDINGISGIILRPCFTNLKDNEDAMSSTEYSINSDFLKEYTKHISAMQIVSECAKIYIQKNWKKVKDWSKLSVIVEDNESSTEYYNYVATSRKGGESEIINKMFYKMENFYVNRHNPVKKVSKVVLDPSDGDFSLTINGKTHLWISDDSVIVIAAYIEKQIKNL